MQKNMPISEQFAPIWERIKNLETWEIVVEIPDDFTFNGYIPYNIEIGEDNKAKITLVAASRDEAIFKVLRWLEEQKGRKNW
jgi:hypothetical protein